MKRLIGKEFLKIELLYRYPQMRSRIRRPQDTVGRPLFFEPGDKRMDARVFVCSGENLSDLRENVNPGALFLCAGAPDFMPETGLDCCIFPPDTDQIALFNFIQRLFDRLDEWNLKLKAIAEGAFQLPELLESAAGMLQNPVWLCDENAHVVACAERFSADLEPKELIESYKMMEGETRKWIEGEAHRVLTGGAAESLCARLASGGADFLLVCAAKERPFYGSDETVFGYLTGYVKLMLSERKISVRAMRANRNNDEIEQRLRAILNSTLPQEETLTALSRLGWDERADYAVCAAETFSGDMRYGNVHAVCDRMERALKNCCAFYAESVVIAVIRLESDDQLHALEDICKKEKLRAGTAAQIRGLSYFQQALGQAKYTLAEAGKRNADFLAFKDAADEYIMERSVSEFQKELICSKPVLDMAAYDQKHGTNYLETAARYVGNRYNAVKTAGELFIHRSTLLYRLERMKTQFGLDMDAEKALSLRTLLSIKMLLKKE